MKWAHVIIVLRCFATGALSVRAPRNQCRAPRCCCAIWTVDICVNLKAVAYGHLAVNVEYGVDGEDVISFAQGVATGQLHTSSWVEALIFETRVFFRWDEIDLRNIGECIHGNRHLGVEEVR